MSSVLSSVLFLLCVLPFCSVLVHADTSQSPEQQVCTSYSRLDAAYSRRDIPSIFALLTPDFKRVTWNAALTAAEFRPELKDLFDGTISAAVTTRLKSLGVHGDTADAVVIRRIDWKYTNPSPLVLPPYFSVTVTQERWREIAGQWRMAQMADTPLVQTLSLLNDRDQSLRLLPAAEWKKPAMIAQGHQIDAANRARVRQIIRQYGWPGFDLAGTGGEATAWEIVQHADDDIAFQRRCLPLIQAAVKRG